MHRETATKMFACDCLTAITKTTILLVDNTSGVSVCIGLVCLFSSLFHLQNHTHKLVSTVKVRPETWGYQMIMNVAEIKSNWSCQINEYNTLLIFFALLTTPSISLSSVFFRRFIFIIFRYSLNDANVIYTILLLDATESVISIWSEQKQNTLKKNDVQNDVRNE